MPRVACQAAANARLPGQLPIYIDAALDQLRAGGHHVRGEDIARLSPLGFDHINMLGRYAFTLPETVARGELRPLRDPMTARDDDG